jgi:hypothetical protein
MKRKPPPTIYTCIAEPGDFGFVVIRWSCDPDALDSVGTMHEPPPKMISKSRVAFLSDTDPDDDGWAISCRCADGGDFNAGLYAGNKNKRRPTDDNGAAGARWLVEGEER